VALVLLQSVSKKCSVDLRRQRLLALGLGEGQLDSTVMVVVRHVNPVDLGFSFSCLLAGGDAA